MTSARAAAVCMALIAGCGSTGGGEVSIPLIAGGASDARSFTTDSGWTIAMDEARFALGPMYFCATTSADLENCPAALAELRSAVTVDALDGSTDALGTIAGRTGTLRSGMWDYGRPFLLGATEPAPIAGAIDGHSARLSGTATRGPSSFRFVAELDLSGPVSGISAVHGVRTTHTLFDDDDALTVRFDVVALMRRIDFDALEPEAVDGVAVIAEGSLAHATLVQALTLNELPSLEWARPE